MIQLSSNISISNFDFTFCNKVEITSSYDSLTDTAKVIIPKKVRFLSSDGQVSENITSGENALFNRGDLVDINLGYDHSIVNRFSGYLAGIKTKFPLEFNCEDNMWFLKQYSLTFTLKNPSLTELIDKLNIPFFEVKVHTQQNLGDFRVTESTAAQVLEELRKKHGVYSWFRDGVLNVGLAVVPSLQRTHRFTIFKDIIDANSLEFINDYDRKVKIVAKSIMDDNTQLEATAGDSSGETRTLYFHNIDSIEDLQAIADSKVSEYKFSGYNGSITTFLNPYVRHGDIIEIVNEEIPEQSGAYLAYKVITTFGVSGGRQKITIKQKVYNLIKDTSGKWIKEG